MTPTLHNVARYEASPAILIDYVDPQIEITNLKQTFARDCVSIDMG
jgi:hypothetical protein